MAREDPQFRIRLPTDLKARVESAAAQSGRSLNAEIVRLLEYALPNVDKTEPYGEGGFQTKIRQLQAVNRRLEDLVQEYKKASSMRIEANRWFSKATDAFAVAVIATGNAILSNVDNSKYWYDLVENMVSTAIDFNGTRKGDIEELFRSCESMPKHISKVIALLDLIYEEQDDEGSHSDDGLQQEASHL